MNGLIVGKFYPLHRGHLNMIEFGLSKCDHVTVIILADKYEKTFSPMIRKHWMASELEWSSRVTVSYMEYDSDILPNSDSTSVSQVWGDAISKFIKDKNLPSVDVVISSELYGEPFAGAMGVKHIMYDYNRRLANISATKIRLMPEKYWEYIPKSVQPYFVTRINILGTESTGKSTITELLAKRFNTNFIHEVGREMVPSTLACTSDLLHDVRLKHLQLTKKLQWDSNKIIICDTNRYITESYHEFLFNKPMKYDPIIESLDNHKFSEVNIYLTKEVPLIQDGTRGTESFRESLDRNHRKVLSQNKIEFFEVGGSSYEERYLRCVEIIKNKFGFV